MNANVIHRHPSFGPSCTAFVVGAAATLPGPSILPVLRPWHDVEIRHIQFANISPQDLLTAMSADQASRMNEPEVDRMVIDKLRQLDVDIRLDGYVDSSRDVLIRVIKERLLA